MTEKVFWQDPYLTRLDTTITSVTQADVSVARTIFYAFNGGQESDTGTIGDHAVVQARKDSEEALEIIYTLAPEHGLKVGDPVTMTIDWERRYRLMRLHFAAEIVLELAYQNLPGIEKIGAHIAQDKSRIDFAWPERLPLADLQAKANAIIAADHPIISRFTDEAYERRCWEIEGFAQVACGGTHIKRTGEIGSVELKRKNIGKNKERIEIYAP